MRSILCFGDSNTWGYEPGTGSRYPLAVRWPGLLQASLGADAHVIEEGLCGRTTAFDIARGMSVLVEMTQAAGIRDILVVAPAPISKLTTFAEPFTGGREKSLLLAERYAAMAAQFGVAFLDAGAVVRSSDLDGFHLDAEAHRALAAAIERAIVKG